MFLSNKIYCLFLELNAINKKYSLIVLKTCNSLFLLCDTLAPHLAQALANRAEKALTFEF
jgi:hypothetical protein